MNCDNCRWFNKTGFVPGFGDCNLNREVHSANHEACEHYEEYSEMTRLIEIKGAYLLRCPFCGSESLKIEKKSALVGRNGIDMRVERHTWSVRCNTCNARGGTACGKVIDGWQYRWFPDSKLPEWATTDEEIRDAAVKKWNRRG